MPAFFVYKNVVFGELKQDITNILSMLCKRKEVNITEAEICPDHVHMLVEIPPKMRFSDFVGYLKGKSTLVIYDRHANLKYKYGNRHFWCRGYYVDITENSTCITGEMEHYGTLCIFMCGITTIIVTVYSYAVNSNAKYIFQIHSGIIEYKSGKLYCITASRVCLKMNCACILQKIFSRYTLNTGWKWS